MKNQKVSIIIPVYNSEKTIEKCINSIITQSYDNLEIIIVNDGSTDDTENICKKINDSRIVYLKKKNGGVASARNLGLKSSTGNLISFVDSDDWISKYMIENMVKSLISNKADISVCRYSCQEKFDIPKQKVLLNDEILKNFLQGNILTAHLWNKVYKRELFENELFNDYVILEDMDMMYRVLSKSTKVSIVDEIFYYYEDNDDSLTKKYKERTINDFIKALDNFHEYIEENHCLNEYLSFNIVITYLPFYDILCKSNCSLKKYRNRKVKFSQHYKIIKNSSLYLKLTKSQKIKARILNINDKLYSLIINIYYIIKMIKNNIKNN